MSNFGILYAPDDVAVRITDGANTYERCPLDIEDGASVLYLTDTLESVVTNRQFKDDFALNMFKMYALHGKVKRVSNRLIFVEDSGYERLMIHTNNLWRCVDYRIVRYDNPITRCVEYRVCEHTERGHRAISSAFRDFNSKPEYSPISNAFKSLNAAREWCDIAAIAPVLA